MHRRQKNIIVFLLVICSIISIFSSYFLYMQESFEMINTISNFAIAWVSVVISMISLIIAVSTYFSIDTVNGISSLDGNVLENDKYTITSKSLMLKYIERNRSEEIVDKVFSELEERLHKVRTNMEFADLLQALVDNYFLLGWCDFHSAENRLRIDKFVVKVEQKYNRLSTLSNGMQYLMVEHIKLIRYLYQVDDNSIEDIRGDMFKNPFTRMTYFNNLGREFYWKALELLEVGGIKGSPFLIENLQQLDKLELTDNQKERLWVYIRKASSAFEHALKVDIYDSPYINFINGSLMRLNYIRVMVFDESFEEADQFAANVINDWRIFFQHTLGLDFTKEGSFLSSSYYAYYARLCMIRYGILAVKKSLSDADRENIWALECIEKCQCPTKFIHIEPGFSEVLEYKKS